MGLRTALRLGMLIGLSLPCLAQSLQVDLSWSQFNLPSRQLHRSYHILSTGQDLENQTASGLGLRLNVTPEGWVAAGVQLSLSYQVARDDAGKATETSSVGGTTTSVQRMGLKTEVETLSFGASLVIGGSFSAGLGLEGRLESIKDSSQPLTAGTPVSTILARPWIRGFLQYRIATGPVLGIELSLPLMHPPALKGGGSEDAAAAALAPDRQMGVFLGFRF